MDRGSDFVCVKLDDCPIGCGQDKDRDSPAGKFLLVAEVLVGGQKKLESAFFGFGEEGAIAELAPAEFICCANGVAWQEIPQGLGSSLGKRFALVGNGEAGFGVGEDGEGLSATDALEPFEELIESGAALDVFEEGFNRDAGSFEDPGAAKTVRAAFDSGTFGPVQHLGSV